MEACPWSWSSRKLRWRSSWRGALTSWPMVALRRQSIPRRSSRMTNLRVSTSLSAHLRTALGYLPALLAAALVAYAIIAGGYFVALAGFALIYAVFVTGLSIFMGYAGQASFGQNAFAAIGGYASAVLTTAYDIAPVPALACGVAGAVVCAVLIGYPTVRLKGHYLAMATLAIG